jgi:preprotein translocase SecE subunit
VAEKNPAGRRPRIRKYAPTVRERQEAAVAKSEPKKPSKVKAAASSASKPLRKLRLRDRRFYRAFARVLRPVGRLLKWLVPRYIINSWREVRKVVWPSRWETWRLTLAVFIFSIIFGALVAAVDKGLDEIFKKVILK